MNDTASVSPMPDPMIDEVRAIRRELSDRFNNDVDRICDHLQELERQHPDWIVEPEPTNSPVSVSPGG